MALLSHLASLLMSSTPSSRKRREHQNHSQAQQQQAASDLIAGDASPRASKRSRSASRRYSGGPKAATAADASQVVDLTGSASPPESPARSRRSGAAARAPGLPAPTSAPSAAAPDCSHGDQGRRDSRRESSGKRLSEKGAGKEDTAAGAGPSGSDSMMFFRSRGTPAPAAEANGSASADELPAWHSMQGAKRLQAELKYLTKQIAAGRVTQMHDLAPVGDNIFTWQFKLKDFDDDCEGGKRLNEDLSVLSAMHGQDHLLMEVSFPGDYPHAPFFLRMVTPRCVWYTGHVTAGGSVCIEVLTQSGTPNSWHPGMCVESIMNTVIQNMLHVESVIVRTATGPGGVSGPLRVDLEGRYAYNVMAPYSEHEAKAAFSRMLSHHKHNGW